MLTIIDIMIQDKWLRAHCTETNYSFEFPYYSIPDILQRALLFFQKQPIIPGQVVESPLYMYQIN